MSNRLLLSGYAFSVYTRAVRMALLAKGLAYEYSEVNPFEPRAGGTLGHPFGRVPVLDHATFRIYETQAILDYIALTWPAKPLMPTGAKPLARMRQVMGIADSYVYEALVRQVVSQVVFAPLHGTKPDAEVIAQGMSHAPTTLAALDEIATEGLVLNATSLTQADCLLWPMLDYFNAVPEGEALLMACPALSRWVSAMAVHPIAIQTAPDLKGLRA